MGGGERPRHFCSDASSVAICVSCFAARSAYCSSSICLTAATATTAATCARRDELACAVFHMRCHRGPLPCVPLPSFRYAHATVSILAHGSAANGSSASAGRHPTCGHPRTWTHAPRRRRDAYCAAALRQTAPRWTFLYRFFGLQPRGRVALCFPTCYTEDDRSYTASGRCSLP